MIGELTAALRWAVGMAEEAIIVREEGDDPDDTPEIVTMHRDELDKARALLAQLDAGASPCPPVSSLPDPDHDWGRGLA